MKPSNFVNLFKRFRKSKRSVKRCSTNKKTPWNRKNKKRDFFNITNKRKENSIDYLKFPSSVSTATTIESNSTEITSVSTVRFI